MRRLFRISSVCFFILCTWLAAAQQPETNNLEQAAILHKQGDHRAALAGITRHLESRPDDANGHWLKAVILYDLHRYRRSIRSYRQAFELNPENNMLALDYGEKLLYRSYFRRAGTLLESIPDTSAAYSRSIYLRSRAAMWTGNLNTASSLAADAYTQGATGATALQAEIAEMKRPLIGAGFGIRSDSQPLVMWQGGASYSRHTSLWSDVFFQGKYHHFIEEGGDAQQLFLLSASNRFRMPVLSTWVRAEAGFTGFINGPVIPTGEIELESSFPHGYRVGFSVNRMPYLYTLQAVEQQVMYTGLRATAGQSSTEGFWWQTGAQREYFDDANHVDAAWIWVLSPSPLVGALSARGGYSFQYAHALSNRFASVMSPEEIMQQYDPEAEIEGFYDPYFTPNRHRIHSLLIHLSWQITTGWGVLIDGKYGIHSRAMQPYFYPMAGDNEVWVLVKDYETVKFNPLELGAALHWRSERIPVEWRFTGRYMRILFYDAFELGTTIRIRI